MSRYFTQEAEGSEGTNGALEILARAIKLMGVHADTDTLYDFCYTTGQAFGKDFPVHATDSLAKINLEMNELLEQCKLGNVLLEDARDHVRVNLTSLPFPKGEGFDKVYPQCLAVLFCGIIDAWFHQSGAPAALSCIVQKIEAPGSALLSFANHSLKQE